VGEVEEQNSSLPRERLIVLESTTYPGTTRKILSAVCERFSQKGTLCHLAYSPERISPGPAAGVGGNDTAPGTTDAFLITRIVGGVNKVSCDTARALYQTIFKRVHPVENPEAAELVKLIENTFRFISIGFANEMARVARSYGLNIWDILEAAKTKGFGLDMCFPGLIGGHCLPIDPHYLGWAYRNRRSVATFVDVAERSHQDARRDALDLILRLLSEHSKGVPRSSILFFGVAYKKNVGDTRESGVLDLMKKLYSYGAKISFWDPVRARQLVRQDLYLTFSEAERRQMCGAALEGLTAPADGPKHLKPRELEGDWAEVRNAVMGGGFDCVVLATDHADFHPAYAEILTSENAPPAVDINNAVELWLRTAELTPEQADGVRSAMHDRSRFMLFGFD
jgi:nucleotide sugar dehydrogenase